MRCGEIQIGGKSFRKIKRASGGSRIEIWGSEGVYLDENCRTNPSRYLPGPKAPSKKLKNIDFGV